MVMLGGAGPERLDQHAKFIRVLHDRHTSKCWWLIYQADIRLRSEKLGRLIRNRVANTEEQIMDTDKYRWSSAFTKAIELEQHRMAEFWNEEFHRQAQESKSGQPTQNELVRDGSRRWIEP